MAKKQLDEDLLDLQADETSDADVESVKAKKKIPKWVIPVGVVVLLILVVVLKGVLGKSKANAFDVTKTILSNELGTFSYTLDVRSSEAGSKTSSNTGASVSDLNNIANSDSTGSLDTTEASSEQASSEQASSEQASSEQTTDDWGDKESTDSWGNKDGTQTGYWVYPNYKLTISGCTMDTDPLETKFTVSLATEYFNDDFTDITHTGGNYYINVEQMRYWLVSSKDSYLVSIGNTLPEGSKYLVIPDSEFYLISRYAENSESDLAHTTSLRDWYVRNIYLIFGVLDNIRDDSCVESQDDTSTVSITGNSAITVLTKIKGLVGGADSVYDTLISNTKDTYPNGDTTQAMREKDNVLEALHNLYTYLGIVDLNTMNLNISGNSRSFTNSAGNQTLEANWGISYTAHNTDYKVSIGLSRSGDTQEITVPEGSTMTVQTLKDDRLVENILNQCADYLNFTDIELSKQLELTPDNIKKDILSKFVQLVNDAGTYDQHLTLYNINEYIEKYANMGITDDSSENDKINVNLVSDFFNTINSITGGVVKEVEKAQEEEVSPYTTISDVVKLGGKDVNFTASYNEKLSKTGLVAVDIEMLYHKEVSKDAEEDSDEVKDDSITVNLTDFSLHNLLASIFPANNETILRDYDNEFDMSKVQGTVKIQPNVTFKTTIYIVVQESEGYMDLWYGDTNFGELINH